VYRRQRWCRRLYSGRGQAAQRRALWFVWPHTSRSRFNLTLALFNLTLSVKAGHTAHGSQLWAFLFIYVADVEVW